MLCEKRNLGAVNAEPVSQAAQIINLLLDSFEGKLSTSKYAKYALRDIKILIERGILTQDEGGGRSTSYRLVDDRNS